jgi:hypothetical protein
MSRRILERMIYMYEIYKYVKLVNTENNKLANDILAKVLANEPIVEMKLSLEIDLIRKFGDERIFFFWKIGMVKAMQVSMAALKEKYLEPTDPIATEASTRYLRVTHLRGLRLLDGIPYVRPGLWKAWYDEHGWLITIIPGGAAGAFLYWLLHALRVVH